MLRAVVQWALLLLLWLPMTLVSAVLLVPLSTPVWIACLLAARKLDDNDPLSAEIKRRPVSWLRTYVSCCAGAMHYTLKIWAAVVRPKVVFVVYHSNMRTLSRFFCMHTAQVSACWASYSDCCFCLAGEGLKACGGAAAAWS